MVLAEIDKKIIIEKYNIQQLSMRKIAKEMNINVNTVKLWIKRFNENGTLVRKRGSGFINTKNKIILTNNDELD